MQRYTIYRDSGVEWLGAVPEHWRVIPLGRIGAFSKGSGGTKEDETEEGVPSVRYGDLYTQHQFSITTTRARISEESAARYTPIQYGDLLFAGSGETIEEIGKSAVNLITERAYCGGDVIVFRPAIEIDAAFLGYAADCSHAVYQKSCMGRGVTVMHIYAGELKHLVVPLPPHDEQRAIAGFLDGETERIDSLIAKKRLLIERLQEYRTALITRAVTRGLPPEAARAAGLDPSPRLKPSGVEWLGDVPEHWATPRLNSRYEIVLGKMLDESRITGEHLIPYLRNIDVQWDRLTCAGLPEMDVRPDENERYTVREGDVLVCEGGEPGRAAIVPNDGTGLGFQKALHRLRPLTADESPRFLFYTLSFAAAYGVFDAQGNPNTILHLTGDMLRAYRFPSPPAEEQREIVSYLDGETARLDGLSACVRLAVERLQEHRTALITAAVTGKIDVRETTRTGKAGLE